MRTTSGSLARMPHVPRQTGRPSPGHPAAERLLSGLGASPGAPPGEQALALVLRAAAGPATERELSGEPAAVTAFLLAARPRPHPWAAPARFLRASSTSRGRTWPRVRTLAVAVGGLLAVAVTLAGTAAADGLPAPLQKVAHSVFGAPAPRPAASLPSRGHDSPPAPAPGLAATSAPPRVPPASTAKAPDAITRHGRQGRRSVATTAPRSRPRRTANRHGHGGGAQGGGNGRGHGPHRGPGSGRRNGGSPAPGGHLTYRDHLSDMGPDRHHL